VRTLAQILRETQIPQQKCGLIELKVSEEGKAEPYKACAYGVLAWEVIGILAMTMEYQEIAQAMTKLGYPEIKETRRNPVGGETEPTWGIVYYLNDSGWGFTQIADWLES